MGVTTSGNENTWLKEDLNDDTATIENRMSADGSNGTVQVGVFVGHELDSTIEKIKCGSARGLYEDGGLVWPPKKNVQWGEGDGTVPYDSAVWPVMQGWAQLRRVSPGSHARLINAFSQDIYEFLTEASPSQTGAKTLQQQIFPTEETTVARLSVALAGAMRVLVTDPLGRKVGLDPATNSIVEQITGSEILFGSDGGGIDIGNPIEGLYTVTYFGEHQADFNVEVAYWDGDRYDSVKLAGYRPDQPRTFQISVSFTEEPRITIITLVQPVIGLTASPYSSNNDTLTRLNWDAGVEAGIISYHIYSARDVDPYFVKLATIPFGTTSFDTPDRWSSEPSIPEVTYTVTAVKEDGSESFFSEIARNTDRDHDELIDVDEVINGTDINDPDTDDDGLSDGEEQVYGTNPLKTDTDEDGFSDFEEIQLGSDPLDQNSLPPCKGDFNEDGDIDGSDLAELVRGESNVSVQEFAANFGKISCP